jgi:hypothetical protein
MHHTPRGLGGCLGNGGETEGIEGAHATERRLDDEVKAASAAMAPSIAASTFSCTMSWASRAFSMGRPTDIQSRVHARIVSAASMPVSTLALAIA